jgi:hypothetical protein
MSEGVDYRTTYLSTKSLEFLFWPARHSRVWEETTTIQKDALKPNEGYF